MYYLNICLINEIYMFDLNSIKTSEDKVLISDAVKLCDQDCYRAVYIIAWLACVEALNGNFLKLERKPTI